METTDEKGAPEHPPAPQPAVEQADVQSKQVEALWRAAGPVLQPLAQAAIGAMERHGQNTGRLTALLLALIVTTFGGVAVYSLSLGYVDTAEKILIALISFLGGAAMFSGSPKK